MSNTSTTTTPCALLALFTLICRGAVPNRREMTHSMREPLGTLRASMTTVSVPDGITGFHKLLVRTRGLSIDTPQFYRVWVKLWAFDRPSIYPRKPGFAQEDSDLLSMCSVFFLEPTCFGDVGWCSGPERCVTHVDAWCHPSPFLLSPRFRGR